MRVVLIGQKICRRRLGLPHRPAAWAQLKTAVGPWPNPGYPVTSSTPRPQAHFGLSVSGGVIVVGHSVALRCGEGP